MLLNKQTTLKVIPMSSQPSINALVAALGAAREYIISTELAWRSQLADAVASGAMSIEFAKELTQGAIDDTETLLIGGAIGPDGDVTRTNEHGKRMANNIGDRLIELTQREQKNGSH